MKASQPCSACLAHPSTPPLPWGQNLMGPTLFCVGVGWAKQTPRVGPTCGIAPFSEASHKLGNPMVAAMRCCLEGVEISALKVMPFDGRSL